MARHMASPEDSVPRTAGPWDGAGGSCRSICRAASGGASRQPGSVAASRRDPASGDEPSPVQTVPYQPSSPRQVANALALLRGRAGKTVDLGSGDGRLVLEAYKQGLRPALGYELNPWLLSLANYRAWKAGYHGKVSFLKEDLWKVNLSDCHNVIVFLAPSVKPPLATKLLAELPDDARVVAGRFPFPSWSPSCTLGQGLEQVWAYDMKEVRREAQGSVQESQV
ncbi:protein FAM173A [Cyanistes caeruleus]|uniref:protein FAM173A n=1 Tax=Cyanistes caeruleus TaxID=156563 RepID=UPI000CDB14FB|nr:protein FAM173A [Cyanistes caeruleus]